MFQVKKYKCDQCLFSDNRIVSGKRMADILNGCKANDNHFVCHKATIKGKDICCRGFFDTQTTNIIRIAGRLNVIEFVD